MQTKQENRDIELENLARNLLIAEYQVERLRERVSNNFGMHGINKTSQSIFKFNKDWYRVTTKVDRLDPDDKTSRKADQT